MLLGLKSKRYERIKNPRGGGGFTRSTNLQPVANRFVAPQRVSHEKKKKKGT
jgi:hypothetical protein